MFSESTERQKGKILKDLISGKKWRSIILEEPSWTQRVILLQWKKELDKLYQTFLKEVCDEKDSTN